VQLKGCAHVDPEAIGSDSGVEARDEVHGADGEQRGGMGRVGEDLAERGELCDAQGLAPPERTLVVRARPQGGPEVSDGPFAETKEFLAGYWLVDVESEARAIEIAAHISTAPGRGGAPMHFPITLRPLGELPGEEM
jgi:hypothetical protein